MFPSEMIILMAIKVASNSNENSLSYSADVPGEYISYLYDSLITRGYLKRKNPKGYDLTSKGKEALLEFLDENRAKAKDLIGTLQQLDIESNQKIDNLIKDLIKVA